MIGQGGFGITYLGSDTRLRRAVAVKECFPQRCARRGSTVQPDSSMTLEAYRATRERFVEEAQVLGRFQHPGIVRVHAAFEENNTAYMVMEFLKGRTLACVLAERGALPEAEAVGHIVKVAEGLHEVHGAGLLHRDVKPDNIIVCEDGRVVLVDFGTARGFAQGQTRRMTTTLTPGYAPLEQYGQHGRFGPYTDVYALSATLYHLLSGQAPVPAPDRATGVRVPAVTDLSPSVSERTAAAVARGMEMRIDRRPQTIRDFLGLVMAVGGREPTPRAHRMPVRKPPWQRDAVLQWSTRTNASVTSLAFSPDGGLVASLTVNGTLALRQSGSGLVVDTGWAGSGLVAIGYTFDRRELVGVCTDGEVKLCDPGSGRCTRRMFGPAGAPITSFALDPCGRFAVFGRQRGIVVWTTAPWSEQWSIALPGHVTGLAIAPNGRALAAAVNDGTVHLVDLATRGASPYLRGYRGGTVSVAFSPDSMHLALGARDGCVRIRTVACLQEEVERFATRGAAITSLAFSPVGGLLAAGSSEGDIHVWSRGAP